MTLREHLAKGYDAYVHGSKRGWTREIFADELRTDADLTTATHAKLAELDATMAAGRQCFVSSIQQRILRDGLNTAATKT